MNELPTTPACLWRESDDGEMWSTSCGHAFNFTADGPKENGMKFCCYCGGQLEEKKYAKA